MDSIDKPDTDQKSCYNQMGPSEPEVTQARLQEVRAKTCVSRIKIAHGSHMSSEEYRWGTVFTLHVLSPAKYNNRSLAPNMLCMFLVNSLGRAKRVPS